MKHARLVILDGPDDWVRKTLANSLRNGRNTIGSDRSITIFSLSEYDGECEGIPEAEDSPNHNSIVFREADDE